VLSDLESEYDPDRPVNEDAPVGSEKGVAGGTSTDLALQNLTKTYAHKINQAIGKYWQVPTALSDRDFARLAGDIVVHLRLSKGGHVVTYHFKKKSGNLSLDSSVERVIRKFTVSGGRKLPLPDNEEVREVVLRQGLNLKGWKSARD
jgi:hypothetical protein